MLPEAVLRNRDEVEWLIVALLRLCLDDNCVIEGGIETSENSLLGRIQGLWVMQIVEQLFEILVYIWVLIYDANSK